MSIYNNLRDDIIDHCMREGLPDHTFIHELKNLVDVADRDKDLPEVPESVVNRVLNQLHDETPPMRRRAIKIIMRGNRS